jgi:hypothetical protein
VRAGALSAAKSRARDIRRSRRQRRHSCWDHLVAAALWVALEANLGTLLRTCDAVGACIAVPDTAHYREALARAVAPSANPTATILQPAGPLLLDPPLLARPHPVDARVAARPEGVATGNLVLYRLAGMASEGL